MLQVNLTDETNLSELVAMLLSGQQDEIILTKADTRAIKMVLEDDPITKKCKSMFGIAKDKWNLPPDFDEWFDAMLTKFWKILAMIPIVNFRRL